MLAYRHASRASAGESVSKYIREVSPFNTRIVALGVDTYLKMLLQDNFVHTDLHPGERGSHNTTHLRVSSV
jgi:hypothetical protein